MEHLKRIRSEKEGDTTRRLEILVCPVGDQEDIPEAAKDLLSTCSCRNVLVCKYAPGSREEFTAWGELWPMNFRPRDDQSNTLPSVCPSDCLLFEENRERLEIEEKTMLSITGQHSVSAILVNPKNNEVRRRYVIIIIIIDS